MEEIRLFYKFKKNLHFVTALLRNFTGFFSHLFCNRTPTKMMTKVAFHEL